MPRLHYQPGPVAAQPCSASRPQGAVALGARLLTRRFHLSLLVIRRLMVLCAVAGVKPCSTRSVVYPHPGRRDPMPRFLPTYRGLGDGWVDGV
jgi:hypothetical protein